MMIDSFRGDYRFLSNFWSSEIDAWGRRYPSVEHYYQAMKSRRIADHDKVRLSGTAGEAKRLGKYVELRDNWNTIQVAVMREALVAKFSIPQLKQKLLDTSPHILIEGNVWHDNFWGNCTCPRCSAKIGVNMLGTLLMSIRSEIVLTDYRLAKETAKSLLAKRALGVVA